MKILFTLFCALTAITAQAAIAQDIMEEEDSMLNVVAYFCKGDTMKYTKRKAKLQITKNDTIVKNDMQTNFMIVVLDSLKNGYRMEFIPTDFHSNMETKDKSNDMLNEKVWELAKSTHLIFTTDELGAVQNIENWKEIRDLIKKGMNVVLDNYYNENPGIDSLTPRKHIESYLLQQLSTEDGIKDFYDELTSLFYLHGTAFKMGKTDEQYSSQGYPSRTIAETGYTEKEDESDIDGDYGIKSNSTTVIPSTDVVNIIGNTLDSFSDFRAGDKFTEVMRDTLCAVENDSTTISNFEYYGYFLNGWPKLVYKERTTDISGIVQVIDIDDIRWIYRHFLVPEEEHE